MNKHSLIEPQSTNLIIVRFEDKLRKFDGRLGWALVQLADAGATGVSNYTHPAPDWKTYIERLRKADVAIETILEKRVEDGFCCYPARYRISTRVTFLRRGGHWLSPLTGGLATSQFVKTKK